MLGTANRYTNGTESIVADIEPIRAHTGVRFDERIRLSGRVLAHEIEHLLAGPGAHCHFGLMNGSWSAAHISGSADTSSLSPELVARIRRQMSVSALPFAGNARLQPRAGGSP